MSQHGGRFFRLSPQTGARRTKLKAVVLIAASVAALGMFAVAQQPNPVSSFKQVELSSEPLYSAGATAKPTLTLALSVEFPTVGAQYRDNYDDTNTYIGYFDSESCYNYTGSGDNAYFARSGAAANHKCSNAFSGNFMNWASSSAIDVLRRGLTGGDRIVDSETQSVLQRAVLQTDFWNEDLYFPSKSISAAQAAGAVPRAQRNANGPVYIANCLNRISFGTASGGTCSKPGVNGNLNGKELDNTNKLGLLVRVQVCDSQGGALLDNRPSLCQRYPSGQYKPVGNLQKYADRIRVAVFGYLLDPSRARYGGILRASMRSVGTKAYDVNGAALSGVNPLAEWDDRTGVFEQDPEFHTSTGNSGVANYLNKFGRLGTPGLYKSYDPVGELYYESLRYLQGLPPTDKAVEGTITDEMKDNFTYYGQYRTTLDPHAGGLPTSDYSCVRNNIVVIGDVETHSDNYIPGNTREGYDDTARPVNDAGNEPDFRFWTNVVGGFESAGSMAYTFNGESYNTNDPANPHPIASLTGLGDQTTGSLGAGSYYIAGIAYWAHTHDIRGSGWTDNKSAQRPGMRVTTYTLDVNQQSADSDPAVRHTRQLYLAAKYGGFTMDEGKTPDPKKGAIKGNPFSQENAENQQVDTAWENPADPGEAKTYFLASSAQAVLDGLDAIFASSAKSGNSIAGAAVSQSNLATSGSQLFNTSFDANTWTGDLKGTPITLGSDGNVEVQADGSPGSWSAQAKLDARTTPRKIVIGNADGTASAFDWSQLPTATKNNLLGSLLDLVFDLVGGLVDTLLGTGSKDTLGTAQVNYLGGSRANEAGQPNSQPVTITSLLGLGGTKTAYFRNRAHLLGDIVNSPVAYSGAPTTAISSDGYLSFYDAHKNRVPAVFVGANDGMLHAFNAGAAADGGGEELFAYIPSWLAPQLGNLAADNYGASSENPHRAFVDGALVTAEADLGTSPANTDWKTVLVGATGAGGQGVYALDVTDPAAFTKSNLLWEFTDRDDPDLGYVVGKPQVLKFKVANATATSPAKYKWFAVVASGVNNNASDDSVSSTGQPAIFLLSLNKKNVAGATQSGWVLNQNYFKLSVPVNATLAATVAPGMINFTAAGGSAGEVSAIYAGDLHGNMWKLDFALHGLSSTGALNWTFNKLAAYGTGTTNPRPLFQAKDSNGIAQPITMSPTLIAGPRRGSILVLFGTGKFLENSDKVLGPATQRQSVYAVLDDEDGGTDVPVTGRNQLMQGTASANGVTVPEFLWGLPQTPDTAPFHRMGWYFDFSTDVAQGERQINDFAVFGSNVLIGSLLPPGGVRTPCVPTGGTMFNVNIATGAGSAQASTVGLLATPIVIQTAMSEESSNNVGRSVTKATGQGLWIGSEGTQTTPSSDSQSYSRRLSWRLIENYRELKGQP